MRKLTPAQERAMTTIKVNGSTGSADGVRIATALNLRERGLITMINHREGNGFTLIPFDGDAWRRETIGGDPEATVFPGRQGPLTARAVESGLTITVGGVVCTVPREAVGALRSTLHSLSKGFEYDDGVTVLRVTPFPGLSEVVVAAYTSGGHTLRVLRDGETTAFVAWVDAA